MMGEIKREAVDRDESEFVERLRPRRVRASPARKIDIPLDALTFLARSEGNDLDLGFFSSITSPSRSYVFTSFYGDKG